MLSVSDHKCILVLNIRSLHNLWPLILHVALDCWHGVVPQEGRILLLAQDLGETFFGLVIELLGLGGLSSEKVVPRHIVELVS